NGKMELETRWRWVCVCCGLWSVETARMRCVCFCCGLQTVGDDEMHPRSVAAPAECRCSAVGDSEMRTADCVDYGLCGLWTMWTAVGEMLSRSVEAAGCGLLETADSAAVDALCLWRW
ncbi:hypothetical protein ACLOJK_018770, partial [Asimina triloba]